MKSKAIILLAVSIIAVAAISGITATKPDSEASPDTYSIKAYLDPDWEITMHEVFINYIQAAANFGKKDFEMANSFLKVMEYYINMLPNKIPAQTKDGKKLDRQKILPGIEQLRTNTIALRKMIEKKEYEKATQLAPDYVTNLCFDCHKNAKVPPKWQMNGYKVSE